LAWEKNQIIHGMKAADDLSTKQYYLVKQTAMDTVDVCAAVTDIPCGVLQNKPSVAGQAAEVCVFGFTKVSSDEALTYGALIASSADGQAQVSTAGSDGTAYTCGQVFCPSGAGDELATAFVNFANLNRGA